MADVSKAVTDRTAISRTVLSSLEVHGEEVRADLEAILFPGGTPKHLTVAALLAALGDALSRAVDELSEADLANAQELADDAEPRAARDEATADLHDQLVNLRGTLASVYGNAILRAYGLTGETPTDAEQLLHRAESVVKQLDERPITEKPRQEGVTIDAAALAKGLRKPMKLLAKALKDVRREEREAQLTLARRKEAMTQWARRYQGIADVATGLFELTGRGDLADRVRPTARRRAGLAEPTDVSAEGDAPAEAPAAKPEPAPAG